MQFPAKLGATDAESVPQHFPIVHLFQELLICRPRGRSAWQPGCLRSSVCATVRSPACRSRGEDDLGAWRDGFQRLRRRPSDITALAESDTVVTERATSALQTAGSADETRPAAAGPAVLHHALGRRRILRAPTGVVEDLHFRLGRPWFARPRTRLLATARARVRAASTMNGFLWCGSE